MVSFVLLSALSNLKTDIDLSRYCLLVIGIALHMINLYNYSFYSACETLAKHGLQKPVSFVLETYVCKTSRLWFCFLFKSTVTTDY